MKCILKKIVFFAVIIIATMLITQRCLLSYKNVQAIVELKPGEGIYSLAKRLKDKDIIISSTLFKLQGLLYSSNVSLKYGEYVVSSKMTSHEILNKVLKGDIIYHKITIPEGLSFKQIKNILNDNHLLTGDITLDVKEGFLLPETYSFRKFDSRNSIIKQMQKAMDKQIDIIWKSRDIKIDKYIKNKDDLLNLAAIVEKETILELEKPVVASVYLNRLAKKMRLQADPTVIYGAFEYEGDITYKMLRDENNVYNTYVIFGLPPTPIANPGLASIKAVANPDTTDYFYFVADGKGGHVFAQNYKQHRKNVKEYLKAIGHIK